MVSFEAQKQELSKAFHFNLLSDAIESSRRAMERAPVDWVSDIRLAWAYGVICGWTEDELEELATLYGWSEATIRQLDSFAKALPPRGMKQIDEVPEKQPGVEWKKLGILVIVLAWIGIVAWLAAVATRIPST
jgi:hypothetical protein